MRTSRSNRKKTRSRYNNNKAREKNNKVVRVVKEIKKEKVKILRNKKRQIKEELILKEVKIYIQKGEKFRIEITWLYYDVLAAENREW